MPVRLSSLEWAKIKQVCDTAVAGSFQGILKLGERRIPLNGMFVQWWDTHASKTAPTPVLHMEAYVPRTNVVLDQAVETVTVILDLGALTTGRGLSNGSISDTL
jgi:hypothetical protein